MGRSKLQRAKYALSAFLLHLLFAIILLNATTPTSARFLQPDTYDPWAEGVGTNR
jgi:hypothetical protein